MTIFSNDFSNIVNISRFQKKKNDETIVTLKISIGRNIKSLPSSMVIEEKLPISSYVTYCSPLNDAYDEKSGTLKWLFFQDDLYNRSIIYEVRGV